jgi:hypothetical protein
VLKTKVKEITGVHRTIVDLLTIGVGQDTIGVDAIMAEAVLVAAGAANMASR